MRVLTEDQKAQSTSTFNHQQVISDLPPVLTVPEMAKVLRIGRGSAYELVRTNTVPHVRVGRLVRIPRDGLVTWMEAQKPSTNGSAA